LLPIVIGGGGWGIAYLYLDLLIMYPIGTAVARTSWQTLNLLGDLASVFCVPIGTAVARTSWQATWQLTWHTGVFFDGRAEYGGVDPGQEEERVEVSPRQKGRAR